MMISDALEALIVGNADFEEVEKTRDVFCPFEAVGMVRQEIRHAHFLAHCLDPQRPHGFGSECLRALMRSAAREQQYGSGSETETAGSLSPLDVHLMDFERTQVRREWRSIDLLLVVHEEKLIVAIELKIDAGEHSGQLGRYRDVVMEEWPVAAGWRHMFLFLTKYGDDASGDNGHHWLALRLSSVASELENIVRKQIGMPEARSLLASYIAMLRRHHLTDERLEEIAARLWSQHREALEFLMDRRPDAADGVYGRLREQRDEIAVLMSEMSGLKIVTEDSPRSSTRFAILSWDSLPDFLTAKRWTPSNRIMLIELAQSGDKRSVSMRFVLGPGDTETRRQYHRALSDAGVQLGSRREITGSWTRLAGVNLAKLTESEEGDVEATVARALTTISEYARKTITAYDRALDTLRK